MTINNWDPSKGDYIKYNASKDRKLINKKVKRDKYKILFLVFVIILILFLSFYHF
jgi:hypothetical protein